MQRRVVTLKWTDVSEVLTASIFRTMNALNAFIALMMEAVRTSETSVNFQALHPRSLKT
jgi:hypothetical protein